MLEHGIQITEYTGAYLILLERHHKTLWDPSTSELMLKNFKSPMPQVNIITTLHPTT